MRRSHRDRDRTAQFDFIIVYSNYLFVSETVANSSEAMRVLEFAKKIKDFFDFFPHYQGKTVVPIFSSLCLTKPIIQLLTKHKIYVMNLNSETIDLPNYNALRTTS